MFDGSGAFVFLLILAGAGHWLCGSTSRMSRLQPRIGSFSMAIGLVSGVVGILFFGQSRSGISGEDLVTGLFTGGLIAMGVYLILTLLVFAWLYLAMPVFRWLGRRRKRRRDRRAARREAKIQRKRDEEWQAAQPAASQAAAAQKKEAQRRDDARFACQVEYDRLAPLLDGRFTSDRLKSYFERYLDESRPAEEVEERADQLKAMMEELAGSRPSRKSATESLKELRQEYSERRSAIEAAGFDEEEAAALIASLAREEERAIREFTQS